MKYTIDLNLQEGIVGVLAGMFQTYWGGLAGIGPERMLGVITSKWAELPLIKAMVLMLAGGVAALVL